MRYVKGFDTIRAFAVFFVIVEHWGPYFAPHTLAEFVKSTFIPNGWFGVRLFFVLSGFLITSILLHAKFNDKGEHKLSIIKNFFVRRSLRIFPIYYLTILVCCLLGYSFVKEHIWYFLTYTSNVLHYNMDQPNILAHTWSLAVEEQFYLIWPWLIIFVNKKYLRHLFILTIIIGMASTYVVLYRYHKHFPYLVINCFDSFGIGGLYAYIKTNKQKSEKFDNMFLVVFPLLLFISWRFGSYSGLPLCVIYNRAMESVIGVALIMLAMNNTSELARKYIWENRFLNFIGKISYGIYLYHFTFGPGYDEVIQSYTASHPDAPAFISNFYVSYCVKLSLLLLLCWLSFRLIEQPILRLKKKFEYR